MLRSFRRSMLGELQTAIQAHVAAERTFFSDTVGAINSIRAQIDPLQGQVAALQGQSDLARARLQANALLLAKLHIDRIKRLGPVSSLEEVEFRVFSQAGEDGIIQYLINRVPITKRVFVEFGVENYQEANTRFLAINDGWKGLVMDGDSGNIQQIKGDVLWWSNELDAVSAFVTRDNVNELIAQAGIRGDIGLLSIDVDGNDYWIWEAVEVIQPRIVICEYNSVFGAGCAVTVPYDPEFRRELKHHSCLYFGASLPAFCRLADVKGYDFVGSNSFGTNAFFVRKDLSHTVKTFSAQEGYVVSTVRESKDVNGNLTYATGEERIRLISELEVFNIKTQKLQKLEDCATRG